MRAGVGEDKLSDQVVTWWTEFARTGSPAASTEWPAFDPGTGNVTLEWDIPKGKPVYTADTAFKVAQCNFWDVTPTWDAFAWGTQCE